MSDVQTPTAPMSKGPGVVQIAVVVAILGGGVLLTALTSHVSGVAEPGIRLLDGQPFLVEKVANWSGGPLTGLTEAERQILPADTLGARRLYTDNNSNQIYCSVVLEGSDVTSIHRPELCLKGQGWVIERERVERLPLATAPGGGLRISCLDAKRTITLPQGNAESRAVFAYWFVGKDRLTPYHWQRIFLTTKDRVLFNRNARWAYFLIYAPMTVEHEGLAQKRNEQETVQLISRFVQDIYPTLVPN